MKKLSRFMLCVLMFCGAFFFGIGIFCTEATKKENLARAIHQMDMVAVVKSEMGDKYELIGQLLDTDEFKDIVGTYTDGFINYMVDGYGEVSISKEQVRQLFSNYSSILLEQYPELAFLPTERFVDFLTESVEVEKLLPSYEQLAKKVPTSMLATLKILKSPWLVAGSLAVFLFALIAYLAMDIKKAFNMSSVILLMVAGVWLFLSGATDLLLAMDQMQPYQFLRPVLVDLLLHFKPLATSYALIGGVLIVICLIFKRRKNQHG